MNFDFNETKGAKEVGKALSAGIHHCKFVEVKWEKQPSQKNPGEEYEVMSVTFDVDDFGLYTQKFFEPTSAERTDGLYGKNPSQVDHFLITVREILEALNPDVVKDIDAGTKTLTGNFKKIVTQVAAWTMEAAGKETNIKLVPQSNGYSNMPTFTARLDKNGKPNISTRIIGDNITLTPRELKAIDNAKNAKPTNMSKAPNTGLLSNMLNDDSMKTEEPKSDVDDLPF